MNFAIFHELCRGQYYWAKSHIDCIISEGLAFWWHCLFFPTLFRKTRQNLFFFETFVCTMAESQTKYGLCDRQKFSRAKKALPTLKERKK